MKVQYIQETKKGYFTKGKMYEVLSITENGWYRIVDDTDESYLYPPDIFTVVEKEPVPPTEEAEPDPD